MRRRVEPEILDELDPDDPAAIRSRLDLTRINALMGNERWIERTVARFPEATAKGIVEIGAGGGGLISKLAGNFPNAEVTAVDRVSRPVSVAAAVRWCQGDVFDELPRLEGGVLIANLFLHHFQLEELRRLGAAMERFEVLVFNEPHRHWWALGGSKLLSPWVNSVTRHDMALSIRAGFLPGELPALLGLAAGRWRVSETSSWRGAQRVLACRV